MLPYGQKLRSGCFLDSLRHFWFQMTPPPPAASSCRSALSSGKVSSRRLPMPAGPVLCVQCDKPEYQCTCDKYCTICKNMQNVRLCMDGLYYCPDCREACDVTLADTRGH